MPKFFTQGFKYGSGDTVFFGEMPGHDHNAGIEFSKFAIDWLVEHAHWPRNSIVLGHFASNQNRPVMGKELKYNSATRTWSKK